MNLDKVNKQAWDKAEALVKRIRPYETALQQVSAVASEIAPLIERIAKLEAELKKNTPHCERCDERDRHAAEAEDGMLNAAEMSGLM